MTLDDLAAVAVGHSYSELGDATQGQIRAVFSLAPGQGFSAEQRALLAEFWLEATPAAVDACNALLPEHVRVAARVDQSGTSFLDAALLTDCREEGMTYHGARDMLFGMVIRRKADVDWPPEN